MKNFKVNRGVAAAMALIAGTLLTIQVGFNTTFGKQVGSPLASSIVSFGGGMLVLLAVNGLGLLGPAEWSGVRRMPWWAYGSGLVGAYYVTSSIIVAPEVGLAAMSATVVAGQLLSSLVVDKLGALGFMKKAVGWPQWLGVALLPIATALILGLADGDTALKSKANHWLLLLSLSAGLMLTLSLGFNTTVNRYLKNAGAAALLNFSGGLLAVALVSIVAFSTGLVTLDTAHLAGNLGATPWWAWLGGLIGSIYVIGVTLAAPPIGAALANILIICGQLLMSLFADTMGLFRTEAHPLTVFRVAGVVLLVIVVWLIKSVRISKKF